VVGTRDGDGFVAWIDGTGALETTFGTDHDASGTPDGYALIDQGGTEYLESVVLDSASRSARGASPLRHISAAAHAAPMEWARARP
jgi:hypothetical protein